MLLSKKSKRVEDLTYLKTNNFRVQIKKNIYELQQLNKNIKINITNPLNLQISKTTPVLQQE